MTNDKVLQARLGLTALAALAAGATLIALPAKSQPLDDDYGPSATVPEVTVRPSPERSEIGAPIDVVRASRVVRADDLNLDTRWGGRALMHRIENAASGACQQLEDMYPASVDNDGDCFRGAVLRARYDVEDQLGHPLYGWDD